MLLIQEIYQSCQPAESIENKNGEIYHKEKEIRQMVKSARLLLKDFYFSFDTTEGLGFPGHQKL